jgi:hypothetical protein
VSAVRPALDPEAEYYQTIEEFFVSRRGDPLLLSSADWTLVHAWRTAGLPLRVVLRGIADALDSHAHSWGRDRKVGSLRYCAAEVDVARERWQRALDLGRDELSDVTLALQGFADALERATGLGARASEVASETARELRQRGLVPGQARHLEPWLAAQEAALMTALEQEDGEGARARLAAEVDAALAPYAARMPARVLAQVRAESLTRRLLALHGVPRLSLFLP